MRSNKTITNASPFLWYSPPSAWSASDPSDPFLGDYYARSYHATNSSAGRGTVTLSWKGSGVWIYGGYRDRLGPYQVTLDGEVETFPGYVLGRPQSAQSLLFGRRDLDDLSTHNIELANLGINGQVLDLDYIIVENNDLYDSDTPSIINRSVNMTMETGSRPTNKTPTIIGATVISVLVLIILCMLFWWRRQKSRKQTAERDYLIPDPFPLTTEVVVHKLPFPSVPVLSRQSSTKNPSTHSRSRSQSHRVRSPHPLNSPATTSLSRTTSTNPSTHSRSYSHRVHSPQYPNSAHLHIAQYHHHHQYLHHQLHHHRKFSASDDGGSPRVAAHRTLRRFRSQPLVHWASSNEDRPGLVGVHRSPTHHYIARPEPAVII